MNNRLKIALLLPIAVFAGCIAPRTSGVWIEKGKYLNVEDPAFAANVEVKKELFERTPEGFLHAQVEVMNTNRSDYECQYRFEWLRENDMTQSHSEMLWRPVRLLGRTPTRLESVCTVKDAEDFRLLLRRKD